MGNMKVATTSSTPPRREPPPAKPAQTQAFAPRMPGKTAGNLSANGSSSARTGAAAQQGSKSDAREDLELYGALGTAIAMQHLRDAAGLFGDQGQSGEQSGDQSENGSDSESGGESAGPGSAVAWAVIEAMRDDMPMDTDSLAGQLAPFTADDGIFELLMPGKETLGVVVNHGAGDLRLLLSPSTETLGRRLKRVQMELEGRLAQRIGRDVNLTVL